MTKKDTLNSCGILVGLCRRPRPRRPRHPTNYQPFIPSSLSTTRRYLSLIYWTTNQLKYSCCRWITRK